MLHISKDGFVMPRYLFYLRQRNKFKCGLYNKVLLDLWLHFVFRFCNHLRFLLAFVICVLTFLVVSPIFLG